MKILFTGATGVLGRETVPVLVANGNDVIAVSRSTEDASWLSRIGATPEQIDLFDAGSIEKAVSGVDTIVHFATAIPPLSAMRKREAWVTNDRIRSEATGLLVDTAIVSGVSRFIQQSVTFAYADGGEGWLDEDSPIEPGWEVLHSALDAESHVDRFRAGGGLGVTLRLSRLYGPGNASDEYVAGVADRKIPIVGNGRNYVSSVHSADVATAVAAALDAPNGTYNITDDEPVTAAEYAESLAEVLGAPYPRRIPAFVGRLALGKAVTLLTTSHRVSNRRFREATGWAPVYPSVREGWRNVIGAGV